MIPTTKLKKLILHCIVKFIDSKDIWDECSNEIHNSTENSVNALEIKEIFYKEILPDLSYNNYGYDNDTVKRLKSLSISSIDWINAEQMKNQPVGDYHSESLKEQLEEHLMSTDEESESDNCMNKILKKEKSSTSEVPQLSDIGTKFTVVSASFNNFRQTKSLDNIKNPRKSLKRRSYSLNSSRVSNHDESSLSSSKRKASTSFHEFSSLSENETTQIELTSIVQSLDEKESSQKSELVSSKHYFEGQDEAKIQEIIENNLVKEIVAEIQQRLNAATSGEEILRILDENEEYASMVDIPQNIPDESTINEPDLSISDELNIQKTDILNNNKNNEKSDESNIHKSQNSCTGSQNPKCTKNTISKSPKYKYARKLTNFRPKLVYDSTQLSESINGENSLTHDTILSGSHKDCTGIVKDLILSPPTMLSKSTESQNLNYFKQPQMNKEEIIKRLQAQLNAAKSSDEIYKILDENEDYCSYLIVPSQEQESQEYDAKHPNFSKEEIIAEIQKQLDAAKDSETIDRILDENLDYVEYLTVRLHPPKTPKKTPIKIEKVTTRRQKSALKIKHENEISDVNHLERNSSRTELSLLLSENINLKDRPKVTIPQPKMIDEDIVIDLSDE